MLNSQPQLIKKKKKAYDPVKISSHFAFSTLIMAFSDQVIM